MSSIRGRLLSFALPVLISCAIALSATAQTNPGTEIPAGSKMYVAPAEGGFNTFIVSALQKKKVPVLVVTDREQADFEITAAADSQKAGWARTVFLGQTGSNEEASINVVNIKSGVVAFAYNVNKRNSARGKQSAAEACAKEENRKQAVKLART